jgi:hypothetical protein
MVGGAVDSGHGPDVGTGLTDRRMGGTAERPVADTVG